MSELRLSYPACAIAGKNRLTAEDVANLRDDIFEGGITSSADAAILLAINTSCPEKCPEWADYFVGAMSDYIVRHCYPQGAMDELNADWLIGMIATGGIIKTAVEFDLLMRVIEISAFVPESLPVLAFDQIRIAIEQNAGHWAKRRPTSRPAVVAEDMALIHTVFSLRAKTRRSVMTLGEVAVLRRIDALSQTSTTPPAWREMMLGVEVAGLMAVSPEETRPVSAAA